VSYPDDEDKQPFSFRVADVAMSADICIGSLGTDTAGSIEIPESYCEREIHWHQMRPELKPA
jgi:hypothetical protein